MIHFHECCKQQVQDLHQKTLQVLERIECEERENYSASFLVILLNFIFYELKLIHLLHVLIPLIALVFLAKNSIKTNERQKCK